MSDLIVTKLMLLSWAWVVSWSAYFAYKEAPANAKTLSAAFAPILIAFALFMLFVW